MKVHYCGFLLQEFQTNMTAIRTLVYNDWDKDSRKSPPQERPGRGGGGESAPAPNLQILAWAENRPLFPAALLTRFAEGTPEFDKIHGLKKAFEVRFPAPAPSTQNTGPARVGGMCDFSIDNGRLPLDFSRCIDLPCIPAADFTKPRLDSLISLKHLRVHGSDMINTLFVFQTVFFQSHLVGKNIDVD